MAATPFKIPVSVLVVVYTAGLQILLIERADAVGAATGLWQSVTGSLDHPDEPLADACWREVWEETGIARQSACVLRNWQRRNEYTISGQWRNRYAPSVLHNTEHVFGLQVPAICPIRLNAAEHVAYEWLGCETAAQRCFSPTNAKAIRQLAHIAHDLLSKSSA
jgi:dihydroneopterin triphosphate diphosphatase